MCTTLLIERNAATSRCIKREQDTYHNVPSTSKTIPLNGGAPSEFAFGLRGANRFGLLIVDAMDTPLRGTKQMVERGREQDET